MDELMTPSSPLKLCDANLGNLPKAVSCPTYQRAGLKAGIVHIGLGNFHRAHQAWYLHRLMQKGAATEWAILGAGVRSYDAEMREKLLAQDCLTTLIELDPAGTSTEVIGAMIDYLPIEDGNAPLIAAMADPAIRIVALTVTEGGYFTDPATGIFHQDHPDLLEDIRTPAAPRTVFGAMVAALKLRRDAGHGPFTVQSCDNVQSNGLITRNAVLTQARRSDPSLADWIETHCTFPNSMVDCIVPATGPDELALARAQGIIDAAPVTHENYRQWIIEDDFCAGRPNWNQVGAIFTDSVHDFETMKIRILNGGHQVLACAGELLSVDTIANCMATPSIAALFDKVQTEEIAPYVAPVPGISATAYVDLVRTRFANPEIHDTTRRVAFDGFARHMGFVLPILRDAVANGGPIDGLCLVEALWARMCYGTREDGSVIAANDPNWDALVVASHAAKLTPQSWLQQRHIYGDLADEPRVEAAFSRWLKMIWKNGTSAAICTYASGLWT